MYLFASNFVRLWIGLPYRTRFVERLSCVFGLSYSPSNLSLKALLYASRNVDSSVRAENIYFASFSNTRKSRPAIRLDPFYALLDQDYILLLIPPLNANPNSCNQEMPAHSIT